VQNGIHEVTRAVSGEGTSRSIGTVCAGSQSKDKKAGARISEPGDRAGPVGLILIGTATIFREAAAVFAQSGTTLTGDDGFSDLLECVGCRLYD
jgi:hypothetical protein